MLKACAIDHMIVADLDYIEQVGSEEIRKLFVLDKDEIKRDVIDNVKSLDGEALVDAIDDAEKNGSWEKLKEVWPYIKGRRRLLKNKLSVSEEKLLDDFLAAKTQEGIVILGRGTLEDYLPDGYRSKDLDKLIAFVNSEDFWDKLQTDVQTELRKICSCLTEGIDGDMPVDSKRPDGQIMLAG